MMKRCEICNVQDAKYVCPRCRAQTCSVGCVKIHKEATQCDGTRDKSAFVALKDFDEHKLMLDFMYLQEVKKMAKRNEVESKQDDRKRKKTKTDPAAQESTEQQPHHLKRIAALCLKNSVVLHLMPRAFTRRKQNKSKFVKDSIVWTVELLVEGERIELHQVKETQSVRSVLEAGKVVVRDDAGEKVLIPVHGRPRNQPLFYQVASLDLTVQRALEGKEIVEFPCFVVCKSGVEDGSILPVETQRAADVPKLMEDEEAKSSSSSEEEEDDDGDDVLNLSDDSLELGTILGEKAKSSDMWELYK